MQAVIANMPPQWLAERQKSEAAQWDEMWNGVLHMPPMPNRLHQNLVGDLRAFVKFHWARPQGGLVRHEVNLTTPEDEPHWTLNYRIPDLVLVSADRLKIDKNEYMVGAPLVVVETPGDETYEKFPFYARLGVPEIWVINRDTRVPEIYTLGAEMTYEQLPREIDGWMRSPATTIQFRQTLTGYLLARLGFDESTTEELPGR